VLVFGIASEDAALRRNQPRPAAFPTVLSMKDTLGVLLAGGAGERLYPLTRDRAKPAVAFGGIYRIIDITLSNCLNSRLRRVFILTQYKALSLNRHIREGWNIFGRELDEFIEILPPMQRVSENWYMGTADAVYQNIYSIGSENPKYVLILSGDHIYKMDYGRMLRQHQDAGADVTVATILMEPDECRHFGVVEIDQTHRITGFQEKPQQTDVRSPYDPSKISASMGVYIFNKDVLIPALLKDSEDPDSRHDFGKDILPRMLDDYRVFSFNFVDENKKEALYWRDVGTLEAYYEANMDLVSVSPVFNLYDETWPIRTHQRQYPPAKFVFAEPDRMGRALDSLISSGCIISGGSVRDSVLSPDVRVNSFSEVESSILFSHVNVGRRCRIRRAILDRDVDIEEGTTIGYDLDADRERYFVTESGITVVTRDYSLFENPVAVDYTSE
jgi:glucose-1-phosphate adenylyltransferase